MISQHEIQKRFDLLNMLRLAQSLLPEQEAEIESLITKITSLRYDQADIDKSVKIIQDAKSSAELSVASAKEAVDSKRAEAEALESKMLDIIADGKAQIDQREAELLATDRQIQQLRKEKH